MTTRRPKKARPVRRVARRRAIPRAPRRMLRPRNSNYATCTDSIIFTGATAGTAPTSVFQTGSKGTTFPAYYNTDIQLADFTRAPQVASSYQQYRIKYFELRIQPDFDTFVVGGPGAQGVPYFYYIIDKAQALNLATSNQQLKSMGAKPIRLDAKTITIRWKPSVLLSTQIQTSSGAVSAQKYAVSPWLNCDEITATGSSFTPSTVCHYGIKWAAENIGGLMSYSATLTAHFEFKKPLLASAVSEPAPESI